MEMLSHTSHTHTHTLTTYRSLASGVLTVFRDVGAGRPSSRRPPHRAGVFGPPAGDLQSAGLQHVCSTLAGWRRQDPRGLMEVAAQRLGVAPRRHVYLLGGGDKRGRFEEHQRLQIVEFLHQGTEIKLVGTFTSAR